MGERRRDLSLVLVSPVLAWGGGNAGAAAAAATRLVGREFAQLPVF